MTPQQILNNLLQQYNITQYPSKRLIKKIDKYYKMVNHNNKYNKLFNMGP
jgi:hypothetical protein